MTSPLTNLTHPPHPNITLRDPGELIAAIPHVLGFHPVDSLVVFGLHGGHTTSIGLTLRVDLPSPAGRQDAAEQLLFPMLDDPPAAAIAVVICEPGLDPLDDLPHRGLLHVVEDTFADAGIPVDHHLWTPHTRCGVRWRCYEDLGCTGVLPSPNGTPFGLAVSEAGLVTLASREDVEATLAPDDHRVLARRADLLAMASEAAEPTRGQPDRLRERLRAIQGAVELATQDEVSVTDEDVVALADALSDELVRDYCLGYVDDEEARAAERLWTALVRGTPGPERASPAGLLAFFAYARGDGVIAGMALERAQAADPGNGLVRTLRSALSAGLPPQQIRLAAERAGLRARSELREILEEQS